MKKLIIAFVLCLSALLSTAQVTEENWERTRDVQVVILQECANALKQGDSDKAVLWYVMTQKLLDPDIIYQFEEVFPETLKLHVDKQTKFAKPANEILIWLKTTKT